jgi:hypothetical protein
MKIYVPSDKFQPKASSPAKGQLILKADWRTIDSPKK